MALTSDYHEIVQARVRRDPEFREARLKEAVQCLLAGEVGVVRILLRDQVIATVGFEQLGVMTGRSSETLTQMFGPDGDPLASDLFEVIALLAQHDGVRLEMSALREEQPAEAGASKA